MPDHAELSISVTDQLDHELAIAWDALVGDDSVFLHSRYFKALGDLGNHLSYRFATYHLEGTLVGVAAFQITEAESSDLGSNLENGGLLSGVANRLLRNRRLSFRVLVLGNSFATGEHGFRFKEEVSHEAMTAALAETIERIKDEQKECGKRISATVIKDFYPESFTATDRFTSHGYAEFYVDPNMIMPLKARWTTFDDYLNALTSKYRTKAKAALKRSSSLEVRDLSTEDMDQLHDELYALYEQVYQRADFRLGRLDADCFFNLKRNLQECFMLKGYFVQGKLVGFQSGFFYDGWLDAHFVGIDYTLNHEYAIYQRMLYEYIQAGIQQRVNKISFGRTAMEIKSTVGAFPVDLKCYIRHRSKAPNHLLK